MYYTQRFSQTTTPHAWCTYLTFSRQFCAFIDIYYVLQYNQIPNLRHHVHVVHTWCECQAIQEKVRLYNNIVTPENYEPKSWLSKQHSVPRLLVASFSESTSLWAFSENLNMSISWTGLRGRRHKQILTITVWLCKFLSILKGVFKCLLCKFLGTWYWSACFPIRAMNAHALKSHS